MLRKINTKKSNDWVKEKQRNWRLYRERKENDLVEEKEEVTREDGIESPAENEKVDNVEKVV